MYNKNEEGIRVPLWKQLGLSKKAYDNVFKNMAKIDKPKALEKDLEQENKERYNSAWSWEHRLGEKHDGKIDFQNGLFVFINMEFGD